MNLLAQVWAVTAMNIRAIPQRLGASLVTVIGVGTVVATMISLLGVGEGVMKSVLKNAQPDRAIVLSGGAAAEYMGAISHAQADTIAGAPGVKLDAAGKPLAQPMAMVIVEAIKKKDGSPANLLFRGSGPQAWAMNTTIRLIQGRMYRPAVHELIVGKRARDQYRSLNVGDHISLRGSDWTVVGAFEDQGGIDEGAIVGDADTVLAAFDRTAYQSIAVQLRSPEDFGRFKDALTSNPQLNVKVKRMGDYYRDQVQGLTTILNVVAYFIGSVMAVGAVFGAINTMYSAVDARTREIATLRAVGFGGTAVVVSVLVEAVALAVPGALLGAAAAWLLFNNHAVSIGGASFALAVTPRLVELGVIWAIVIGLIGGLPPSIRAARLPVAQALAAT